jgi:hypothetical protein
MKQLLSGAALAVLIAVPLHASAQTSTPRSGTQTESTQQNTPGTGGVSKPGTPGKPGSKSGPAAREPSGSSGTSTPGASGTTSGPGSSNPGPVSTGNANQQDQSKVPGVPGNKSGPSPK